MTPPDPNRGCYVYRLYDADDVCLYVGVSVNPTVRLDTHRIVTAFGQHVARSIVTAHENRAAGLAVEAEQIRTLRPRWNVAGRVSRRDWTACDYFEVIERHTLIHGLRMRDPLRRLVNEYVRRFPDTARFTLRSLHLEAAIS